MKRLLVFVYTTLLFAPVLDAQESTPDRPPMEQQGPRGPQAPGPGRSNPPAQEAIPVPVPIAPPKPNGPIQKSLVRITATSVEPDHKAHWNAAPRTARRLRFKSTRTRRSVSIWRSKSVRRSTRETAADR